MKKLLALSLVVLLALTACPHNNKIDPNAPLELTVENLAGKWVKESNTTVYWSFTGNNFTNSSGDTGTYTITGQDKILVEWYDSFFDQNESKEYPVIVFKTYIIFNSNKYIKE